MTVESIGIQAFRNCEKLESVTSLIENPVPIDERTFGIYNDSQNYTDWRWTTATLYVPKGCKEKYASTAGWLLFNKIEEIDATPEPTDYTDISKLDNVIYLEEVKANAGGVATLSFRMKNSATIRGFQFDLYLPDGVTAVKNAKGRIQGALSNGRLDEDDEHTLTFSEQADGSIRFLCGSQYDETFKGSEGEIATLQIKIADDMDDGEYPMELKNMRLSETDISKYYDTESVISRFVINSYMPGDINGDGVVNVSDYIGIANHILGSTPTGFIEKAADVNEDNTINVSDYIGVANIILTGSPYGNSNNVKAARVKAKTTDLSAKDNVIYVEPMTVEKGTTQATLSFMMKNTADIRGFQFDLYLPEGVTAVKNAKGRIQGSLSSGRLPEDDEHTLTIQAQADGAIRFLCGSQYDETFTGHEGEIATLQVNIADDIAAGDYSIILKGMRLSETDISKFYDSDEVETTLTVQGGESQEGWHDGDIFTAQTIEGVEMTFQVISAKDKTCAVGEMKDFENVFNNKERAVYISYNGAITIPSMVNGFKVVRINDYAFINCKFTSANISNGIVEIGESAFDGCINLTSVTIPNSVTRIEATAFTFCSRLQSINLPCNLTYLGDAALQSCDAITTITIPKSVTYFGGSMFYMNEGLTSVYVEWETPIELKEEIISNSQNVELYVPKGTKALYKAAKYWQDFKEIIEYGGVGIAGIAHDDKRATPIYNLSGQHLTKPQQGVNIVNGRKVVVK